MWYVFNILELVMLTVTVGHLVSPLFACVCVEAVGTDGREKALRQITQRHAIVACTYRRQLSTFATHAACMIRSHRPRHASVMKIAQSTMRFRLVVCHTNVHSSCLCQCSCHVLYPSLRVRRRPTQSLVQSRAQILAPHSTHEAT